MLPMVHPAPPWLDVSLVHPGLAWVIAAITHPALEWVAAVLALAAVGLGVFGKRATWPMWMVASLLYALVFARSKLWADALLQFVFIAAACWGWLRWGQMHFAPAHLRLPHYLLAWLAAALLSSVLQLGLRLAGGSAVWGDAVVTSASLVAQALMVQQKIEHWHFWLIANLCAVALFWSQQLLATALLYSVFAALALSGWYRWRACARSSGVNSAQAA